MGQDIPEQIAHYKIKELLGEGGFGVVYRAWDTQLETHVALKMPKLGGVEKEYAGRIISRFLREARAAARLPPHTNLCPVREVGKFEDQHYVVMAYILGAPLSRAIRPMEVEHAVRLVRKIARAMQVAHDHGVVHRDLKPSNIMLVDRHEPVVMDFGLALRMDVDEADKTTAGRVLGTPAYMSLEQIEGRADRIGPPSDVYSLGVIFYELLTGRVPYRGDLVQMVGKIIKGEPFGNPSHWNQAVTPDLEAVCLKAMARDRDERYRTMMEFALALTDCLAALQKVPETVEVPPLPSESPDFTLREEPVTPRMGSDDETLGSPAPILAPFDREAAWLAQEEWSGYLDRPIQQTNAIKMELTLIPPGEFVMGSPETELERISDEFQHVVRITQPFYLGTYPVTQAEFSRVMNCNPSQFNDEELGHDTSRFPVEMVSWYDALEFCNKLSARDGRPPYYSLTLVKLDERGFIKWASLEVLGGVGYRLPSEAEWEYACRAGTETANAFGDSLSSMQANFNGNSPYGPAVRGPFLGRTSAVGCYPANGFGVYDMHGNVWEWCWDGSDEDYYRNSPTENPTGPSTAVNRVIRGGSWRDRGAGMPGGSGFCRSAARHDCSPVVRLAVLGFRVAVTPLR